MRHLTIYYLSPDFSTLQISEKGDHSGPEEGWEINLPVWLWPTSRPSLPACTLLSCVLSWVLTVWKRDVREFTRCLSSDWSLDVQIKAICQEWSARERLYEVKTQYNGACKDHFCTVWTSPDLSGGSARLRLPVRPSTVSVSLNISHLSEDTTGSERTLLPGTELFSCLTLIFFSLRIEA